MQTTFTIPAKTSETNAVAGAVAAIFTAAFKILARRRSIRQLNDADPRMLADIGIERSEIVAKVCGRRR